uniref:Ssu-2 homolog n=1 Tax=Anolis carolinensis TaxID=28377 RepID=A0A803SP03_ANOCA
MIQTPEPFAPPSYEDVTSGDGNNFHSPHSIDLVHEGEPPTSQRNRNATAISEDVAKEVFAQYVASHCCYSKDPAKEMVICDLRSFDTYRYRLETFSESSSCKWKSVPYRGEPVDPSLQAHAPYPWDVQVEVSPMFKDQKKKVKVPHTSSVKECPQCRGQGDTSCSSCGGSGLVSPVVGFLENAINEVSLVAIEEHRAQFMTPIPEDVYPSDYGIATWNAIENPQAQFPPTVRIRRQKQTIELLHLTRVEYEWHGKHYSYYVYGNEQKIYTEYYPKKCCCTVM